ncbi:MAG: YezD family protein [Aureliella sp.]
MNDSDELRTNLPIRKRDITDAEFEQVRQSLQGLLFGSVSIVVQDGVIVQIDRTEKRRLRANEASTAQTSRR